MKSFRDGLAIRERLAKTDPSNAGWQHDVAVAHDRVGDELVAQGNLDAAPCSLIATSVRFSIVSPSRTRTMPSGSVIFPWPWARSDDVLLAQGDADAALASYMDDLAIAKRLAEAIPGNAGWQRDLAVSYNKVGSAREGAGQARRGAQIL